MTNREIVTLILLLAVLLAVVVIGCAWLIVNIKPLAHLLLIAFLATSG